MLNYSQYTMKQYYDELEEIMRVAEELDIPLKVLRDAVEHGEIVRLENWDIENCDAKAINSMSDVEKHAKEYERDWNRILDGVKNCEEIPLPLVLYRPDFKPYLIGGNTRLMVYKALWTIGMPYPKVLKVEIDYPKVYYDFPYTDNKRGRAGADFTTRLSWKK